MNLATIPPLVWTELANLAIILKCPTTEQERLQFKSKLRTKFYTGLYSTASSGVKYPEKTESASTWKSFVDLFKSNKNKSIAEAFGPQRPLPRSVDPRKVLNQGTVVLQMDKAEVDYKMARPYESYNHRTVVARFQFVVHSGGGIVLFNRMRRACQEYIHTLGDRPEDSAAVAWKVFSEEAQIGRSDSCVTYLAARIGTPALDGLIREVWQNTKDLVDGEFEAMGMTRIGGHPIWGFDVPRESREIAVLGETARSSAGGLMGNVLKIAYLAAMEELTIAKVKITREALVAKAKIKARLLVDMVYA